MGSNFLESHHVPQLVTSTEQPKGEDMFENDITSDIASLENWGGILFIVTKLDGAVGTAVATIESCDTNVPGTGTEVDFRYRKATTPDTVTAWTDGDSGGVTITAGADEVWEFSVYSSELYSTDSFVRFVLTEVDGTAVDGSVITILFDPRYGKSIPDTVLT